MKKILSVMLTMLLALSCFAQDTYNPPTVYVSSGLTVKRTAGTVNNGGKPVAVAADATGVAMTDEKTDCAAPTYTSCNIIYAGSTGTVSVTTTIATAAASGNTIIAYVSTHLVAVTSIVYGWQSGTPFSNLSSAAGTGSGSTVKSCGTTTTCAQTVVASPIINYGICTASAATTCVVTALAFTSATSYSCSVTDMTTAANNALKITQATTTLTITTTSSSDAFSYICIGT